jgi:uncharacterized membrane protein
MNRILVVVFDNEAAAEVGSRAMKHLDTEGAISLYAMRVIAKDAKGKVTVKEATGPALSGTGMGLAIGGIIGLLAPPIGIAVGAITGSIAGAVRDFWVSGVGLDFVEQTDALLKPGKVALIAEVEEEWIMPVDARMQAIGGHVIRRERAEIADAHLDRDISVLRAELQTLESEAANTTDALRKRLSKSVTVVKLSLKTAIQRAKIAAKTRSDETSHKVSLLEHQLIKANDDIQVKLHLRIKQVRGTYTARSAKLKQAWALTKDAISA